MLFKWVKFTLSIPRATPMTKTEAFTQWSALVAYCLGGLSLLVTPQMWEITLQLKPQGRSEGYLRLAGFGVFNIGFILVITARSYHKAPGHRAILWSILGRYVFVNGVLLTLILRGMIPYSFGLVFIVLDSVLASVTLVIWCRDVEGASVKTFFQEICCSPLQCRDMGTNPSIIATCVFGICQVLLFLILTIEPSIARIVLGLDSFVGYSDGFLASFFFSQSIHGLMHITNECSLNLSFSSASLLYRVAWNVLIETILFSFDQIEQNLFIFLLSFDCVCFTIILGSMLCAKAPWQCASIEPNEILALNRKDKN